VRTLCLFYLKQLSVWVRHECKKYKREELKNSGKDTKIVEKIAIGKLNKFIADNTLLNQEWIMEPKKKVKDILKELSINDLKIKDFYRLKIGE